MHSCAVLVNYFGAEDTAAAAWSVQSDCPSTELLVVDNSVDEREAELLARLMPDQARLWLAPENLGFAKACNLAYAATTAEFVMLVNPDVRLLPGCLQELLAAMGRDPELGAVAPRQFLDETAQWRISPSWFPTAVRAWATERALRDITAFRRVSKAVRSEAVRFWTATASVPQRALSGGALMVRRSALGAGELLFDPGFFMYYEDSDFCGRMRRRGWRLATAPRARAVHLWRNQPHKASLMAKANACYFEKHAATMGRWLTKAEGLRTKNAVAVFPDCGNARTDDGGLKFPVPPQWQERWLAEISLSPIMTPSIGMIGAGPVVRVRTDVVDAFCDASVYVRLGPVQTDVPIDALWYRQVSSARPS